MPSAQPPSLIFPSDKPSVKISLGASARILGARQCGMIWRKSSSWSWHVACGREHSRNSGPTCLAIHPWQGHLPMGQHARLTCTGGCALWISLPPSALPAGVLPGSKGVGDLRHVREGGLPHLGDEPQLHMQCMLFRQTSSATTELISHWRHPSTQLIWLRLRVSKPSDMPLTRNDSALWTLAS